MSRTSTLGTRFNEHLLKVIPYGGIDYFLGQITITSLFRLSLRFWKFFDGFVGELLQSVMFCEMIDSSISFLCENGDSNDVRSRGVHVTNQWWQEATVTLHNTLLS